MILEIVDVREPAAADIISGRPSPALHVNDLPSAAHTHDLSMRRYGIEAFSIPTVLFTRKYIFTSRITRAGRLEYEIGSKNRHSNRGTGHHTEVFGSFLPDLFPCSVCFSTNLEAVAMLCPLYVFDKRKLLPINRVKR